MRDYLGIGLPECCKKMKLRWFCDDGTFVLICDGCGSFRADLVE